MNFFPHSFFTSLAAVLLTASQALALPHVSNPPVPQHFYALRDRLGSIMGLVDAHDTLPATLKGIPSC